MSIYYLKNIYTFVCFIFCSILILFESKYLNKIDYQYFYTTFILIMIPFVLVNGALTGTFFDKTVVLYNPEEIIGLRLFTIPVEDTVYAFQLILANLIVYKYFYNKSF